MGRDLADAFPAARAVFEEVDDALGQRLSRVMWQGAESDLTMTENAQPALMAVSIAVVRVIEGELGRDLDKLAAFVAGHSLGEYSALAAARAFGLADTARLLRLRGQAMQKAVPVGEGAMAALIGVDEASARALATAAAEGECCDLANDNGGGQIVLSGAATAIARAVRLAPEHGVRRAVPLPVSAPFHSALMAPAADAMAGALGRVTLAPPILPVVTNVSATPTDDPDIVRERLVAQVCGMVRWRESVEAMVAAGVVEFVECGAGKVLTGLSRRIAKDAAARAVGQPADIDQLLKDLA
jgi:[acyl-carrier-protein] S-malonyltransferase